MASPSAEDLLIEPDLIYQVNAEESFSEYIRQAWPIIEPGREYISNWHIDLIAEYLELCERRELKRVVFNIPPKAGKSSLVSVLFPTWVWGPRRQPHTRWIFGSYSDLLSTRDSINRRNLMRSDWYAQRWGDQVRFARDQDQKTQYKNTRNGEMVATSVSGAGTGLKSDFIIIDDPHNAEQAHYDAQRAQPLRWYDDVISNRLDDKINGVIALIMQRLHIDDLTGHLLELGGYTLVKLPARAPEKTIVIFPRSGREIVREEAELLNPQREPDEALKEIERAMGPLMFEGQYQQNPVPPGGAIFKIGWFLRYTKDLLPKTFNLIVQAWDTAVKTKQQNDYSVCTTWGVTDTAFYLLDRLKDRLEFPDLKRTMHEQAIRWKPHAILIEDASSGSEAIQELQAASNLPIMPIPVTKDKIANAKAVTPYFAALRVFVPFAEYDVATRSAVPAEYEWVIDYLNVMTKFPKVPHDDDVDSTSIAFNWMRVHINDPVMALYRRENAATDTASKEKCAKCGKIIVQGLPFVQARGLKFCSAVCSW